MTYLGHFLVKNLKRTNQQAFSCHVIADSAIFGRVPASLLNSSEGNICTILTTPILLSQRIHRGIMVLDSLYGDGDPGEYNGIGVVETSKLLAT